MDVILWAMAVALAGAFALAGGTKLVTSRPRLVERLPWAEDLTVVRVRMIGVVELVGAVGLLLPPALGVAVVLAPVAAAGLAVAMALACAMHVRRGDGVATTGLPVVLGVVAAVIAWGRFGPYAF